ncbi:MAG TPA: hypothetical protein VNL18_01375 [Gemmatimonadales bacterium]|nr:hypothetical protein [Gemmatimonadales bacterium]
MVLPALLIVLVVALVVPAVVVSVVPRVVRGVVPSVMRALAKEGLLDGARDDSSGREVRESLARLEQRVEELEERSDFLERMLAGARREGLGPLRTGE